MTIMRAVLAAVVAFGLLSAPFAARGQQAAKMPRVGYLGDSSPALEQQLVGALRQGLRDLGYVDGQNVTIEYRSAEGKRERLPALAAELVRLKVDVIVTLATSGGLAAKQATNTIPVVVAAMADPARDGLVASLARPGGMMKETENAAQALRLRLQLLGAGGPAEFDRLFSEMSKAHADALLVFPSPMLYLEHKRIVALAAKSRLPTLYPWREAVDAGGLIAYGANIPDLVRRAAVYAAKILRGAKAAELPVEQPSKFELLINLKAAKALGLAIPPSLLSQADQIIE